MVVSVIGSDGKKQGEWWQSRHSRKYSRCHLAGVGAQLRRMTLALELELDTLLRRLARQVMGKVVRT